jgi:hypothetical protein
VDHRLVREGYIEQISHPSGILYLFLLTVSDAQGLSYYSDPAICKRLKMDQTTLNQTRDELVRLALVAYNKPLYQVLPLDPVVSPQTEKKLSDFESLGQIFKQAMEVKV